MRRKIIEIYVEENEDEATFLFEKVEDSEIANNLMKTLLMIFYEGKNPEDSIEAEYEEE